MMIKRAHRRREIVVRVALEVHVLGEVLRLHQFADIVEIGTDAAERGVRADRFRGRFREVRDHEAVVIGARRFDRHPAQQRMIEIRRFEPGDVGRDLKEMFQNRKHAADDRGRRQFRCRCASALWIPIIFQSFALGVKRDRSAR